MSDLRRQFLESSVQTIVDLKAILQTEESISELFLRQIFREIHTFKGTAQIFGLIKSANLAHDLETLVLSSGKIAEENQLREILIEGLTFLIGSLQNKHFEIPTEFAIKLNELAPETEKTRGVYFSVIPPQIFDQLSEFEKNKIETALNQGKHLYRLDVNFDYANFSEEFKSFQNLVGEKGEIIFTLPAETVNASDKIGFQVYLSSREVEENLQTVVNDFDAMVVSQISTTVFADDLRGFLSQIAAQGEKLGRILGKEVEITISTDELKVSPKISKLIFDIVLHLVKNSIDHSIEKEGTIEIRLRGEKDGLQIVVADDGKGVDLKKVRLKAIDKNLILLEEHLSDQEILELIFLPGFSTAEKISEISGRGVGLDAVKELVMNTGGTIGIKTQEGNGTTFEIFLPVK